MIKCIYKVWQLAVYIWFATRLTVSTLHGHCSGAIHWPLASMTRPTGHAQPGLQESGVWQLLQLNVAQDIEQLLLQLFHILSNVQKSSPPHLLHDSTWIGEPVQSFPPQSDFEHVLTRFRDPIRIFDHTKI